jgi:hypothetical protein
MFRFTIRDLLWLMVVVGLVVALWAERAAIKAERASLEKERASVKAEHANLDIQRRRLIEVFKRVDPDKKEPAAATPSAAISRPDP